MSSWPGRTSRIERPPIAHINRLAHELEEQGAELINMGQAVLGLPPPQKSLEAVRKHLDEAEVCGYSPDPGLPHILDRLALFLEEFKDFQKVGRSNLLLTAGANQAFVNALLAVTDVGDEVVFFGPNYFDHLFAIELAGCIPVEVETHRNDTGYELDLKEVEAALSSRTRALVLVSPSNPTGTLFPEAQVQQLCRLCQEWDIWLFSDETYDLLTFPPHRHASPVVLSSHKKIAVVGSFSKTFGLAGWRVGYLYGPPELVEETIKVQDAIVVCASVPSQYAVLGALEESEAYRKRALSVLTKRRDALLDVLQESSTLDGYCPDGGTFVLADLVGFDNSFKYSQALLEGAGIITVPGSAFGQFGEGRVRISFGNQTTERIRQAGQRLLEWETGR